MSTRRIRQMWLGIVIPVTSATGHLHVSMTGDGTTRQYTLQLRFSTNAVTVRKISVAQTHSNATLTMAATRCLVDRRGLDTDLSLEIEFIVPDHVRCQESTLQYFAWTRSRPLYIPRSYFSLSMFTFLILLLQQTSLLPARYTCTYLYFEIALDSEGSYLYFPPYRISCSWVEHTDSGQSLKRTLYFYRTYKHQLLDRPRISVELGE